MGNGMWWRTAEFALASGAAYAGLSLGEDPMLMVLALLGGVFFAQLGIWTAQSIGRCSKIIWSIVAALFFIAEGAAVYFHTHPASLPEPPKKEIALSPMTPPPAPIDKQVLPDKPKQTVSGPTANWKAIRFAFDPTFDTSKIDATYKVKIALENVGIAASSNVQARHSMYVSLLPLTREEIDREFAKSSAIPLDMDFLTHVTPSIEHGQTMNGTLDGPISYLQAQAVSSGTAKLYIFSKLSWVDTGTPKGMYRTEELCVITDKDLSAYSLCDYHNTEPRLKYLPAEAHQPLVQPKPPKEK
jgi:hypothetical protein